MSNLIDVEQLKQLVLEEGKSARNILAFNVPHEVPVVASENAHRMFLRKPPSTPKPLAVRLEDKVPKLVTVLKGCRSRIRSASAGRDRKSDLQARYWGLLFENLRRAVDEIYTTCETDESIEECKEAIMILESCTKDFRNLIEWLRLKWNYEQTPAPQRPTSLAWEVRKSSPAKPSCAAFMSHLQKTPAGLARRILRFDEEISAATSEFLLDGKTPLTAGFPIETIREDKESNTGSKIVTSANIPATPRKPVAKASPDANPKLETSTQVNVKALKTTETPGTSRVTVTKPKPPLKPGKASKNAVNSEVQSLAQKTRSSNSTQKTQTPASVAKLKQPAPSISKPVVPVTQSWAQRLQSIAKQDQPNQQKPKLAKIEAQKPAKKSAHVRSQTAPLAIPPVVHQSSEQEEGWETVRGRTRSRTSPAHNIPALTRASTVIYTSRHEAKQTAKANARQPLRRIGLLKTSAAQSLPSLCDRIPDPPKPVETPQPVEVAEILPVPLVCDMSPNASSAVVNVSTDEEKDEPDEALESAEEEAEMARREQALTMEEENLQREIRETERSDTEGEESWEEPFTITPASTPEGIPVDPSPRSAVERDLLEEKYQLLLQNCSWADQMELLDQLEEVAAIDGARQPGRALQVHEKLSSPSRRRLAEPCEAFMQHEAKQRRAQEHRAALREEKARKRRELTKRMEEVRQAKEILLVEKKQMLERKMKRAEEKRQKHLAEIVKKAHDEEEKKKEIAFINTIEAQNKRHDFIAHIQTQEERIQGLQEERERRREERKAAKEAALERKRALEAERQAKMALLQEKRRQTEERIHREHQEKEKERLELAREKQRDREERLVARQAACQALKTQLQQKIQQKQEESARRHEENMEQIRQKALELSILRFSSASSADDAPRLVQYDTARTCSLCNVQINSEVILMSHLRGRKHMEALKNHHGGKEPSREQSESSNLKFIIDARAKETQSNDTSKENIGTSDANEEVNISPANEPDEKEKRTRALKKRVKKLKSKVMQQNASESTLPSLDGAAKHRISKIIQNLERDPNNSERTWAELIRLLEKGSATEQLVFGLQRGAQLVSSMLNTFLTDKEQGRCSSSERIMLSVVKCMGLASRSHLPISIFIINTKAAPLLLSLLAQRLGVLEGNNSGIQTAGVLNVADQPMSDELATAVMSSWTLIVEALIANSEALQSNTELVSRVTTLISFAVSLGLIDRLAYHLGGVRGQLVEENSAANEMLLAALKFLTSLVFLLHLCQKPPARKSKGTPASVTDNTQLIEAFQVTELAGVVNALYGLLLHQGVPAQTGNRAPELTTYTLRFAVAALQLIHRIAILDLAAFQGIVGAEGVSLEFRHIVSFLLWYGVKAPTPVSNLLNLTILCIGYFATGHHDNQMILQSGHMPSVLQQLCRLPFNYFSDKALRAILLPTLLACCHDNPANRDVLQKEMSYQMVEDYVNGDDGRAVHLVQLVLREAKP